MSNEETKVMEQIGEDFLSMFNANLTGIGVDIAVSAEELATYAAERSQHLSTIVNEPGFQEAVTAERDSVALRAGISAVESATAAEARLFGMLQGGLTFGARALAGIPGVVTGLLG